MREHKERGDVSGELAKLNYGIVCHKLPYPIRSELKYSIGGCDPPDTTRGEELILIFELRM